MKRCAVLISSNIAEGTGRYSNKDKAVCLSVCLSVCMYVYMYVCIWVALKDLNCQYSAVGDVETAVPHGSFLGPVFF